jgi:integrase
MVIQMPMKKLEESKDKTLNRWLETLKQSTARPYKEGMKRYVEFTGLSPTELIEQARQDYIDRVPPWEIRSVKSVEDFIQHLKKQGLSNMSMLSYFSGVRNFYSFNKVPLPKIDNIGISATLTERYKEIDLIKLEDVRKFITTCGTDQKMLKALALCFLSSGQAQSEIQSLKGKHLNKIINGVAVIKMTRAKTNIDYVFFLGSEALAAIKEYKPLIGDEDFIFTQDDGKTKLNVPYIDMLFSRHSNKLGYKRGYINPHRFRHYFKTALTGNMDTNYIEYLMGHKLRGVEDSYFIGTAAQDKILEAYTKNQDKLTVFTDAEVLQKQYDELKKQGLGNEALKEENARLNQDLGAMQFQHEKDLEALQAEMEEMKRQQIAFYKFMQEQAAKKK